MASARNKKGSGQRESNKQKMDIDFDDDTEKEVESLLAKERNDKTKPSDLVDRTEVKNRLWRFVKEKRSTLPTVYNGFELRAPRPNPKDWPDFTVPFPNPTFDRNNAAIKVLSPTDFYLMGTSVTFLTIHEFFDLPPFKCKCGVPLGYDTWSESIRQVIAADRIRYFHARKLRTNIIPCVCVKDKPSTVSTFLINDEWILGQLPKHIRNQIEIHFTRINLVDTTHFQTITRGQINGQSASDARDMIHELHRSRRANLMRIFYGWATWKRDKRSAELEKMAENAEVLRADFRKPPLPEVKEFFEAAVPVSDISAAYILVLFILFFNLHEVIKNDMKFRVSHC